MTSLWRLSNVAGLLILLATSTFAHRGGVITETFDAKDKITISTTSGDCTIKKSDNGKIEVRVDVDADPEDAIDAIIRERTKSLRLQEKIFGSCRGGSFWEISVPDGTRIQFSSASGEFLAENVSGEFEVNTASGDIEFIDCKGEFDLNSASGTVSAENCSGYFHMSTASGYVEASGVKLDFASEFSTASGRVRVILAESPTVDLDVSTASGRAVLDYDGNPLSGNFEFVCRERKGRMSSPVDFETEEKFRRHGERYIARTFTKGSDTPQISLGTATGSVTLKD
ncbi:MAG: DUF4097 family beta strand repeat protein [Candidatus Zixiibacteriota bacterium]|nr:MAG: DUF4097 family beta strand repeat protein [candidate division Zixibacteria bacterium]